MTNTERLEKLLEIARIGLDLPHKEACGYYSYNYKTRKTSFNYYKNGKCWCEDSIILIRKKAKEALS